MERASPVSPQHVLVRYHEIALKGRNRPYFLRQLEQNLRAALQGVGVAAYRHAGSRFVLRLEPDADLEALAQRLGWVFGVAGHSVAEAVPADLEAIEAKALEVAGRRPFASFRITVQRSDKRFPMTSLELERHLGRRVQERYPAPVRLREPDLNVHVEIVDGTAYCHAERLPGPGGLPVGVSGTVIALLSGGIDSPVAAYRLLKRGCRVVFLHFHAFPYQDGSSRDKAVELVRILTRHQFTSTLYLVPFGEVQREVVLAAPAPYRVVLYRRLMLRVAQQLAERHGALALVTGEAVGQVASQTLENIAAIEDAVQLPVMRPLIGNDKQETIDEAQRIGTYEVSIQPDEDCCTLFLPRHPATRATLADARAAEGRLAAEALVERALAAAEVHTFRWPEPEAPVRGLAGSGSPSASPSVG